MSPGTLKALFLAARHMIDHYHTLGLERGATPEDVKAAYRRLALQYHPDRNPDPKAAQQFVRIQRAYEVLGNPRKRSTYDSRSYQKYTPRPKTEKTTDRRKYGTRHPFSTPPPSQAARHARYGQYLADYSLLTKSGLKLPRHIWRKRFAQIRQESWRNHRWMVFGIVAMFILGGIVIAVEKVQYVAINAFMVGLIIAWNLISDKAPKSLAERKARAPQTAAPVE